MSMRKDLFKVVSGIITICLLCGACSSRNYFLVNSESRMKYNRASGDWYIEWKTSASGGIRDSITDTIRVDRIKLIDNSK